MKRMLLEGKRVFKQETKETRFLFLDKDRINQYFYLSGDIAIKKGDLLYPSKWIRFENNSSLVSKEEFNISDYEFIFYPEKWLAKDVEEAFDTHIQIQIDENFTSLLALDELPIGVEQKLRRAITCEAYTLDELAVIEAYSYPDEDRYLILDSEYGNDDITYEYTEEFADLVIVDTYVRDTEDGYEFLYKAIPQKNINLRLKSSNDESWFYHKKDNTKSFVILTALWCIEDVLQFTNFKETKKISV